MSMRVEGLLSQYNGYKVDIGRVKHRIEKQKSNGSYCDGAEISTEGKKALESKLSALAEQRGADGIRNLSTVSSYGYLSDFEKALSDVSNGTVSGKYMTEDYSSKIEELKNKFEKENGEKTDSFDCHVNKMVSAYNMMRDKINAKYSNPAHEAEYYVADNGEIEELTKEKELEMLDKAYANHSTFMATSTEIWAGLQDFTPTVVYHEGGVRAGNEQAINESQKNDTTEYAEKGKIKDLVYQAFMSAVSDENRVSLAQQEGSLNHFKLHLNISGAARDRLNSIWDYYANKT